MASTRPWASATEIVETLASHIFKIKEVIVLMTAIFTDVTVVHKINKATTYYNIIYFIIFLEVSIVMLTLIYMVFYYKVRLFIVMCFFYNTSYFIVYKICIST